MSALRVMWWYSHEHPYIMYPTHWKICDARHATAILSQHEIHHKQCPSCECLLWVLFSEIDVIRRRRPPIYYTLPVERNNSINGYPFLFRIINESWYHFPHHINMRQIKTNKLMRVGSALAQNHIKGGSVIILHFCVDNNFMRCYMMAIDRR